MTTTPSEDFPDNDKCDNCGNPNCSGKRLSKLTVRTLDDDEGETFVHVGDLERLMSALREFQTDMSASAIARLDEDSTEYTIASMRAEAGLMMCGALAANTINLIAQLGEAAPTADSLPDNVPTDWVATLDAQADLDDPLGDGS